MVTEVGITDLGTKIEQNEGVVAELGDKSWNNKIWDKPWIQNKMTGCDKFCNKSWDTNWYRNWIQSTLTGGHKIWNSSWQTIGCVTSCWVSIETVGQAVGARSDKICRQITFGVYATACRTMPALHQQHEGTGAIETKLEYHTQLLASMLCRVRVDVCFCPKIQKANQRPLNLDKQRCENL